MIIVICSLCGVKVLTHESEMFVCVFACEISDRKDLHIWRSLSLY